MSQVNHPSHYNTGKFETIDVIEDWKLNFNLGNCVKYLSRAGRKYPEKEIEDLEKAKWYLERELERKKKEKASIILPTPDDPNQFTQMIKDGLIKNLYKNEPKKDLTGQIIYENKSDGVCAPGMSSGFSRFGEE